MRQINWLLVIWVFFLYLFLQAIFFRNFVLFHSAFCYIYVSAILLLPLSFDRVVSLIYAFLLGMGVDILYDSLGVHSAACVLVAYLRKFVIRLLTPSAGYDEDIHPSLKLLGFKWFFLYTGLLVFFQVLLIFLLESSYISLFLSLTYQMIATFVFTICMIIVFQYLFYR